MQTVTSKQPRHEHAVQFYENDKYLIHTIKRFILDADAIIIIARSEHKKEIEKGLKIRGLSPHKAKSSYVFLDATKTLSKFMVEGLPHPRLFAESVGALVTQMTKDHNHIRAFGEMVALLWEESNAAGAIMLEELWNDLQNQHGFSLLCAYPIKSFKDQTNTVRFSYMCKCHSKVLPTETFLSSVLKTK
jgi:hypothetical protein